MLLNPAQPGNAHHRAPEKDTHTSAVNPPNGRTTWALSLESYFPVLKLLPKQ